MSPTMSSTDPFKPNRRIMRNISWWGTEENASLRSSQVSSRSFPSRRESVIIDLRRKLCSAHPSKAKKPFCAGENADDPIAHEAMRLAMRAEYSL